MKKRMPFVLALVVVVALLAAYFSLSDKARRAEENVRRVELLHMGDGGALAAELSRLSARRPEDASGRYELGESLRAELAVWDADLQSALSESGVFAFLGRWAKLDDLANRRTDLGERIEAFLAEK
jgi:hypothetical protein